MKPIINFFRLLDIIKKRGNKPLIRRSRRQLRDFILCRNDLNRKCILMVPLYWWKMLKGLDMLVWRLETFGFLHLPETSTEQRARINQFVES